MTNASETVDLTPTWVALVPLMVAVLQNANAAPGSHEAITESLLVMAQAVDAQNAAAK